MRQQITAAFAIALIFGSVLLAPISPTQAADAKSTLVPANTNNGPALPPAFLRLVKEKRDLEDRIAKKHGLKVPSQVWDFFTAAGKGDWVATSNLFFSLEAGLRPRTGEAWLPKPLWGAIHDTYGVYEEIVEWSPYFLNLFGSGIAKSIPSGSIYFGGTDTGRFGPTLESASHNEGRPFFTLTQNALADEAYLGYLRDLYGGKIYIPGTNEAQQRITEYTEDAGRRLKLGQLKPGEDVRMVDGTVKVGGQVAVMAMNGLLVKAIFDRNPRHEFYYEESFPVDWLNPHLTPHQFIFKVNRQPPAEISAAIVRADREFWTRHVDTWLGTWLNTDTPVREITNFVIRTYHEKNLTQFKGDPRLVEDVEARKSFSKLRCAIGGVYSWRAGAAQPPEERQRMITEADFAFRQAFALAPQNPEVVFRYVNLLVSVARIEDALCVAEASQIVNPDYDPMKKLIYELARIKGSMNR